MSHESPETFSPADNLVPDFTLIRCIGRGSYGEVWLARNVTGVLRAVKIVRRAQFADARPYEREFAAIQRYEPVSRAAEGLVHVLHVGRNDEAGFFYYVMELADDAAPTNVAAESYSPRTLRSELVSRQRLPIAECRVIALALARALDQLRNAGLVHRDIKPANIILVRGAAKLADIGLLTEQSDSQSFVGTEGYIAPEGPGHPSADLFALGRVLYEACTGFAPGQFPRLPDSWLEKNDREALEFFEIVLRAGEPSSARRYQSAAEMSAELSLLDAGRSVRRARKTHERGRWALKFAAAGAGLAAVAFCVWLGLKLAQESGRRSAMQETNTTRAQPADPGRAYSDAMHRAEAALQKNARSDALTALRAAGRLRPGDAAARDAMVNALALPPAPGEPVIWRRIELLKQPAAAVNPPERYVRSLSFTPDGRVLAAVAGNYIHFIEPGSSEILNSMMVLHPVQVAFAIPGLGLLVSSQNYSGGENPGGLFRWRFMEGAPDTFVVTEPGPVGVRSGHRRFSLARTIPSRVVIMGLPGTVVVSQEKQEFIKMEDSEKFRYVAMSPEGSTVAASRMAGSGIVLWEAATGKKLRELPSEGGCEVMFAPDGRSLLAAGPFAVTQWNVEDWKRGWTRPVEIRSAPVSPVVISGDGRLVAAALGPARVALLNPATGEVLARLETPGGAQSVALAISNDGAFLAVGCADGGAVVWDLRALRRELSADGLDWPGENFPPAPPHRPVRIQL